jgi:hypothetical protein
VVHLYNKSRLYAIGSCQGSCVKMYIITRGHLVNRSLFSGQHEFKSTLRCRAAYENHLSLGGLIFSPVLLVRQL